MDASIHARPYSCPGCETVSGVTFYRPNSETSYKHVYVLFSRVADWDLIEAH
jgi:hypothetical protein